MRAVARFSGGDSCKLDQVGSCEEVRSGLFPGDKDDGKWEKKGTRAGEGEKGVRITLQSLA